MALKWRGREVSSGAPRRASESPPAEPSATSRRGAPPALAVLGELAAIGREMVAIPAEIALAVAERLGLVVLAAWRLLVPVLRSAARAARALLGVAERQLTPARVTAAVAVVAIAALVASQFVEYRVIRAGVPDYAGVGSIAPAPRIDGTAEDTGAAHAYLMLPLAAVALGLVVGAMRGRWRLARLLVPVGLAVVAISLAVDLPSGLDEGLSSMQFEGAEAELLEGFWVQLFAGVVIAVTGPILAAATRPRSATQRARRERRERPASRRAGLAGSPVEGARP